MAEEYHGWAKDETALFLAPRGDEGHIGLYLQLGRDTQLAAVFVDEGMAQMTQQWLDESLAATGAANAELLRRLQVEQPLLFSQPPTVVLPPEDDEDPDGD